MDPDNKQYSLDEFKELIGKTIVFEVEVSKSSIGDLIQHPVFTVKEVKECKNGNAIVIGYNLIRLSDDRYNMQDEKSKPYRAYRISNIKYGSVKIANIQ